MDLILLNTIYPNQAINISSKDIFDNSKSYVITQSNSYSQIDNFITPKFELISINFDSLFFNYDRLKTKNVPVVLKFYNKFFTRI